MTQIGHSKAQYNFKYGADFEVRFNPAKTVYICFVHTIVEIRNLK